MKNKNGFIKVNLTNGDSAYIKKRKILHFYEHEYEVNHDRFSPPKKLGTYISSGGNWWFVTETVKQINELLK